MIELNILGCIPLVNLGVNEMDSFSIRLLTLVILLSLNIVLVWLLYLELNINLRHFFWRVARVFISVLLSFVIQTRGQYSRNGLIRPL
jgi:hypothetical protein